MNKKSIIIQNLIVDRKLDVLVITETWHEGFDSISLRRAALGINASTFLDLSFQIPMWIVLTLSTKKDWQ